MSLLPLLPLVFVRAGASDEVDEKRILCVVDLAR
jgi:hypothetical protein